MKEHYDFSKGERGKFFIGNEPYDVVIHVDRSKPGAKFEVFSDPDGKYRFRLATASTVIFTSEQVYDTKDDCLAAIAVVRQNSPVAPTVFQ